MGRGEVRRRMEENKGRFLQGRWWRRGDRDSLKRPQDDHKRTQDRPKRPQDHPKKAPRRPQDHPKKLRRGPKITPRSPKRDPRPPKTSPGGSRNSPKGPERPPRHQGGSQIGFQTTLMPAIHLTFQSLSPQASKSQALRRLGGCREAPTTY